MTIHGSAFIYTYRFNRKSYVLYIFLIVFILVIFLSLPLIRVDVSVKTTGIIRPSNERTEVKSILSGIIDTIYYTEGNPVKKGDIILRLKDLSTKSKIRFSQYEIDQRKEFINDLSILTSDSFKDTATLKKIHSPLYREQFIKFFHQLRDSEANVRKTKHEVEINSQLAKDRVISPKEYFDITIANEKAQSVLDAFTKEQFSAWQQELVRYRLELSQLEQQREIIVTDASQYFVKAPISGVMQGINTKYTGSYISASDVICTISPDEKLIGECYVPTKDIGLLKIGQSSRFQFEAFDYNYFGVLTGRITSIDNDFVLIENRPVIKVRCSFDSTILRLKNGFVGQLKKGMEFQANFLVTKRTLWQMLFDKVDDWLNPNSPK